MILPGLIRFIPGSIPDTIPFCVFALRLSSGTRGLCPDILTGAFNFIRIIPVLIIPH